VIDSLAFFRTTLNRWFDLEGRLSMAGAATVEKALDVLFFLHDSGGALGPSEIGRALDLPRSSCHRLLTSLVEREIVDRDAAGRYRPGLALLSLGIGAQRREPVVQAARSALEEAAERFGETVFLVGLRHGRLRVLDRVEGPGFLRAAPGIGDVIPPGVTAAGQLYRVFGGLREATEGSLEGRLARPDAASAAVIEELGYAVNRDAWIDGLSVLGVPVWQARGQRTREMVGVLALAASSPRFEGLGEGDVAASLLAASGRIAERLRGEVP
jgi:DNA-binding IclR family transcriptional regulator